MVSIRQKYWKACPPVNTSFSSLYPKTRMPLLLPSIGSLPLPPYVRRPAGHADEERYQTVYAKDKNRTAVAAPTAGLHFTPELIDQLLADGHNIHDLTLSVGLGTFRPIETDRVEDHPMHAEEYFLSPATKSVLRDKSAKKPAIGTTCVRAIEHYLGGARQLPGLAHPCGGTIIHSPILRVFRH